MRTASNMKTTLILKMTTNIKITSTTKTTSNMNTTSGTTNQPKSTKPNLPMETNHTCQTKWIKSRLPKQIDLNLPWAWRSSVQPVIVTGGKQSQLLVRLTWTVLSNWTGVWQYRKTEFVQRYMCFVNVRVIKWLHLLQKNLGLWSHGSLYM